MESAPPNTERFAVTVMAVEPADTVPVATPPSVVSPLVLVKYARFDTDKPEVVAMTKAFASVPEVVIVPPDKPSPVATDVTVPPPDEEVANHPAEPF